MTNKAALFPKLKPQSELDGPVDLPLAGRISAYLRKLGLSLTRPRRRRMAHGARFGGLN